MSIEILYEDQYLMVVNKPAGIIVEPDHDYQNVMRLLKKQLPPRRGNAILQNVHRLDRPVSGCLLIARKASVLKLLSVAFATRAVAKTYQALVSNKPPLAQGSLRHWLIKDNEKHIAIISDTKTHNSQEVLLDYKLLSETEGKYLIEITPHTGKYHQIRAQLAHIGCPIIGDSKYGSTVPHALHTIALHASRLQFSHPITGVVLDIQSSYL